MPPAVTGPSLAQLLEDHWTEIEADLADRGIDVWDPAVMARPWPWLRARIAALLTAPRVWAPDGTAVPVTRFGLARWTPPDKWRNPT